MVTKESNPVNYFNAKEKLEKKGFNEPIEQIGINEFIEKAKEEKNG